MIFSKYTFGCSREKNNNELKTTILTVHPSSTFPVGSMLMQKLVVHNPFGDAFWGLELARAHVRPDSILVGCA
jgi:hypothetical protein